MEFAMRRRLCMWRDCVSSCKQPNVPVLAYHPQECNIARLRGRCLRASCGSCTTPLTEELLLVPSPARLQDCKIAQGVLNASCGWCYALQDQPPARLHPRLLGQSCNLAILRVVGPAGHSITRKMHPRLPGQSCNLAILRVVGTAV